MLLQTSGPVLGPTQRPLRWLPGVKQPVVQLDTHSHLVPRLRMNGALRVLPLIPSDAHEDSHTLILCSAVYWPLHSACQTHTRSLPIIFRNVSSSSCTGVSVFAGISRPSVGNPPAPGLSFVTFGCQGHRACYNVVSSPAARCWCRLQMAGLLRDRNLKVIHPVE